MERASRVVLPFFFYLLSFNIDLAPSSSLPLLPSFVLAFSFPGLVAGGPRAHLCPSRSNREKTEKRGERSCADAVL